MTTEHEITEEKWTGSDQATEWKEAPATWERKTLTAAELDATLNHLASSEDHADQFAQVVIKLQGEYQEWVPLDQQTDLVKQVLSNRGLYLAQLDSYVTRLDSMIDGIEDDSLRAKYAEIKQKFIDARSALESLVEETSEEKTARSELGKQLWVWASSYHTYRTVAKWKDRSKRLKWENRFF